MLSICTVTSTTVAVVPSIVNRPSISLLRPTAVVFTPASTSSTRYPNSDSGVGTQLPSKLSAAAMAVVGAVSAGTVSTVVTTLVASGAGAAVVAVSAFDRSDASSASGESLMKLA